MAPEQERQMERNRFKLTFVGQTPLVMNNNTGLLTGVDKGHDKAKWELDHFMDSTYRTADGVFFIPSRAIKKALTVACKFVPEKPKGAGFKSFSPLVEAALVVEDDAVLDVEVAKVIPWTVIVNLD